MSDSQREFFDSVSREMLRPWPVKNGALAGKEMNSEWGVAALLYGMKNWEHGRFDSAAEFFGMLDGVASDLRYGWVRDYRNLVRGHALDANHLKSVPREIAGETSKELDRTIERVERLKGMIRTEGRATRFIDYQLSRMNERRDELKQIESIDLNAERAKVVAEEHAKIDGLLPQLKSFAAAFQFREGEALLENTRVTTEEAQAYLDDLLFLFSGCRQFVDFVVADLNAAADAGTPFSGNFQMMRNGPVFSGAAVVKATPASFAVDRRGAVFTVAFEKMPIETLTKMGQWSYESAGGVEKRIERAKALAVFSYVVGEANTMENMAREASSTDEAFRQNWISALGRKVFTKPDAEEG